jgi:hypothetical protein
MTTGGHVPTGPVQVEQSFLSPTHLHSLQDLPPVFWQQWFATHFGLPPVHIGSEAVGPQQPPVGIRVAAWAAVGAITEAINGAAALAPATAASRFTA